MQPSEILSNHLEKVLKLNSITNSDEANLCFAYKNDELKDDFKISFTSRDLETYLKNIHERIFSSLISDDFMEDKNSKILLPKTAEAFWNVINYRLKS